MSDNRFVDIHENAVSGEIMPSVKALVSRCESGEVTFDNGDMSLALKFGELTWRRLLRLAEHYERLSKNYQPGDSRAAVIAQAAKDMRFVLSDVARDL